MAYLDEDGARVPLEPLDDERWIDPSGRLYVVRAGQVIRLYDGQETAHSFDIAPW